MVMLGRTAEALFWIGRYTERAENHARLIDVYYHIREEGETDEQQTWSRLIDTIGDRSQYLERYKSITEPNVLIYTTLERNNTNSLLACTNHARSNLRTIREKMPSELWDILNGLFLWLKDKEISDITDGSPHLFYRNIRDNLSMFQGAALSIMPRQNEWFFVETGRYLERAENILRLLRSLCSVHVEEDLSSYPVMLSVLKSVSGYEAFRRDYADTISFEAIMEFLLLSDVFPRSVNFCFSQLETTLRSIEEGESSLNNAFVKLAKIASRVKANLACMDQEDLLSSKMDPTLNAVLNSCNQMGVRLSKTFFPSCEEVTA
jgi:uncharacterized alpha-E superfamily protein